MKFAIYSKVPNEVLDNLQEFIKNTIEYRISKIKGKKFMDRKIVIGYDGDDFALDLKTIIVSWTVYKKPRFIK